MWPLSAITTEHAKLINFLAELKCEKLQDDYDEKVRKNLYLCLLQQLFQRTNGIKYFFCRNNCLPKNQHKIFYPKCQGRIFGYVISYSTVVLSVSLFVLSKVAFKIVSG